MAGYILSSFVDVIGMPLLIQSLVITVLGIFALFYLYLPRLVDDNEMGKNNDELRT